MWTRGTSSKCRILETDCVVSKKESLSEAKCNDEQITSCQYLLAFKNALIDIHIYKHSVWSKIESDNKYSYFSAPVTVANPMLSL